MVSCRAFEPSDSGLYPSASCHIATPFLIGADIYFSSGCATVSLEKAVLTAAHPGVNPVANPSPPSAPSVNPRPKVAVAPEVSHSCANSPALAALSPPFAIVPSAWSGAEAKLESVPEIGFSVIDP